MTQEIVIIPRSLHSYSATWANRPLTDLSTGDLFDCTDRKVLYRWDGSAWQALSYYIGSGLYADRPSAADLPDGSMYYATDNGINYQVSGGTWLTVSSIALKWSGATVHNSTVPSSWTDLDLSAIIGAKQTIVVLEVRNSTGSANGRVSFRPNGSSYETGGSVNFENAAVVNYDAILNCGGLAICTTDANGILEMKGISGQTVTIKLLGFIN
jgi:hypothetical protein